MTLRLRLLLMIGGAMLLLWSGVALWMLHDLDKEMQRTLDKRLEMSTHMVAALMTKNPAAWEKKTELPSPSTSPLLAQAIQGLACQFSLRGEVIASTPGALLNTVDQVPAGFSDRNIKGEAWRIYSLDKQGLRITTADRMTERDTLLRNVLITAVVPFFIALMGSLMVLWLGVGHGLRPLERLRQTLANRAPEALTPIENIPVSRDLQPLVKTLNHLLTRMNVTLNRERRFTSDAAHELRTPLTAIKTHLQVARITQGQATEVALDYADEGVERLQHTLSQLLTLSQVEGDFDWDAGHLAEALEVAHLAMRDASSHSAHQVVLESDDIRTELALPQALAVTALRNLLDNALRHSPADKPVTLVIERVSNKISFSVCDRGPGLSEANLTLATQRFWRRDSGRGSGLGLSIVVAIAERFGGSVKLEQRAGGGLTAVLTLPSRQA